MAEILPENKDARIRTTTFMVEFTILSRYLSRGTVENQEKLQLVSASKLKH